MQNTRFRFYTARGAREKRVHFHEILLFNVLLFGYTFLVGALVY